MLLSPKIKDKLIFSRTLIIITGNKICSLLLNKYLNPTNRIDRGNARTISNMHTNGGMNGAMPLIK